jgi:orotidine-5'-phosphate decarboxylase
VPRFWEKVYIGVQEKIENSNPVQRKLMRHAVEVGRKYNIEYLSRGKRPPLALKLEYETYDKTLFALVRTSNPSAVDLQDLTMGDRKIYEVMGELVKEWGEGFEDEYGYNRVGAVIGATWPEQLAQMRKRMPRTFLLVPGYGAQGGTAEDVKFAFDKKGHGAIVNSSRGIMCAWKKTGKNGEDYQEAARNAALEMREAITAITPIEE